MKDLTLALEELRDELADIHHEISVLEQIRRKLISIVERSDGAGSDLVRRHLGGINRRRAAARARQRSIVRMLEECARERNHLVSVAVRVQGRPATLH